ncbi:hypothetical protein M4L39_13545 [Staphylococcus equorum]|uniref:hypothetical protein n=1 Tax=Staphylococcus equorum TaxID=246432 RepID=UPI002407DA0C|nr:hypothetical protein [Staphylococcus equorum]MDG0844437.1 hypothetical protein [Staphylococcus equorum]
MAKIKKTDISKLSKLDQQIEELKIQKKKQEEDLAKNIGSHFMNNIDIDELETTEDLYNIIDEVLGKFNNIKNNNEFENNDFKKESSEINNESESVN